MPTPFNYARLDSADRQIADARAALVKLRTNANSNQQAQIDAVEKLLATAGGDTKALRVAIGNVDDERIKSLERGDRLDADLKVAAAGRAAAEQQAKTAKDQLASREMELADTMTRLTAADQLARDLEQQAKSERQAHESRVKLLNEQMSLAADRLASLQGQLDDARAKLNATTKPKIGVSSMLSALGEQLISVNKASPTADQPFAGKFVVERLEVELKGGFDLSEGIGVVPPTGDDLTPENASTIRFSIRPNVELRAIDDPPNDQT
ncbi:MAG: hypothetical protein AMXMBFR58_01100 [Phycisphaerae bacterium]|nr:hypothetical protein [Phycisphaerales bacterium]MCK6477783.1 hypothetical protein [Phycisphaerales bacterium]